MREVSLSKLLTTTTDVYYYSSATCQPAPCPCSLSSNVTNTEFWQMVCNKITCVIEGALVRQTDGVFVYGIYYTIV